MLIPSHISLPVSDVFKEAPWPLTIAVVGDCYTQEFFPHGKQEDCRFKRNVHMMACHFGAQLVSFPGYSSLNLIKIIQPFLCPVERWICGVAMVGISIWVFHPAAGSRVEYSSAVHSKRYNADCYWLPPAFTVQLSFKRESAGEGGFRPQPGLVWS